MPPYANSNGTSSVVSYRLGNSYISVTFRNGQSYTYSVTSVGQANLNRMIALARAGAGLNSFIKTVVNSSFSKSPAGKVKKKKK